MQVVEEQLLLQREEVAVVAQMVQVVQQGWMMWVAWLVWVLLRGLGQCCCSRWGWISCSSVALAPQLLHSPALQQTRGTWGPSLVAMRLARRWSIMVAAEGGTRVRC
jgi:hypothetical protein